MWEREVRVCGRVGVSEGLWECVREKRVRVNEWMSGVGDYAKSSMMRLSRRMPWCVTI